MKNLHTHILPGMDDGAESAEAFPLWRTGRKAKKLVRSVSAQMLISDCHDMNLRKPNIAAAMQRLGSRTGNLGEYDWLFEAQNK